MFKLVIVIAIVGAALGAAPRYNVSIHDQSLKIVGGTSTDISLHPFQVSVQFRNSHFCGGFLISANWVVTAAHCLTQGYSTNLNIRAGSSLTTSGGQTAIVSRYIIHPSYRDSTTDNDIALLQLATSITVANARAAVLPNENQALPDNSQITITGWGATRENGTGAIQLQQVQVPVVNQATCRNIYAPINAVTNNMFCAGLLNVGGKDSCQGDSGGPAAFNGQVVGVVSWGAGCARPQYPGVYARVAALRAWIRQNTGI